MRVRIWLAMLAVYIFWGSTYLAIRYAVGSIPPFLMAASRHCIAGLILFTWMRIKGVPLPKASQWRVTIVMGLFLLLGGNGLLVWAEQHVISSVAALMIGSVPLWIVLVDSLRPGGRRPGWQVVAGVMVGFIGIVVLINPFGDPSSSKEIDFLGTVALLSAALSWAIGSIYGREHHAELPREPLLATSMEMLGGGAGLLLLGTFTGEWSRLDLSAITTNSLLGLGYLILFGSLIAFAAYTWLLGVAPTPLVSTYAYVNPLVAILLGSLIAKEPITPRIIVAALVIVGAVVLINTEHMLNARRKKTAQTISG
jgi:drug/metabolite transporter (DMT)-like permease